MYSARKNQIIPSFDRLLNLLGIESSYENIAGEKVKVPFSSVLSVVKVLYPKAYEVIGDEEGRLSSKSQIIDDLCDQWEIERLCEIVDPVQVFSLNGKKRISLAFPEGKEPGRLKGILHLESGERIEQMWEMLKVSKEKSIGVGKKNFHVKEVELPKNLPLGYHRLVLKTTEKDRTTLLMVCPEFAYTGSLRDHSKKTWGLFLPLYALRSAKNLGIGDLGDMGNLLSWVKEMGGSSIATLPLFATFIGPPFHCPSPYSPITRLFWNEIYINVEKIPELSKSKRAQEILESPEFREKIQILKEDLYVDYEKILDLKRKVIQECFHCFSLKKIQETLDFKRFLDLNPLVEKFANFIARTQQEGKPWSEWLPVNGTDRKELQMKGDYHLYVQWLLFQQMEAFRDGNDGLYLDLPLGVHPHGFDIWAYPDSFLQGTSVGAPPDPFFSLGQNWGFPPLHPQKIRENGYEYFISMIRKITRYTRFLRLDHIQGIHRLYLIPDGKDAKEGVYLKYRPDEIFAILKIESHRQKTVIVGEDLGTVPEGLRKDLEKNKIFGMYVLQFELNPKPKSLLSRSGALQLASLNTHDMPTFSSFWNGKDIEERSEMGLLNPSEVLQEKKNREEMRKNLLLSFQKRKIQPAHNDALDATSFDPKSVLWMAMELLAKSPSPFILFNLEDLWLEDLPQNTPGTSTEKPNWVRKSQMPLNEIVKNTDLKALLKQVSQWRIEKEGHS